MSDELLPYYERELTYIRQLAAKFAEDHPKIAERLRIDPQHADDPHVERLIEAFAYLTARVRRSALRWPAGPPATSPDAAPGSTTFHGTRTSLSAPVGAPAESLLR